MHITKREADACLLIAAPLPSRGKTEKAKKRARQNAPPDVLARHAERLATEAVAEFIAALGRLLNGRERKPQGDGGWHHMSDRRIEAAIWASKQHDKAAERIVPYAVG